MASGREYRAGRLAPRHGAPQANRVAERFVRTVRSEGLDWLLILNQQHLERILAVPLATSLVPRMIDISQFRTARATPANDRAERWCAARPDAIRRPSRPVRAAHSRISEDSPERRGRGYADLIVRRPDAMLRRAGPTEGPDRASDRSRGRSLELGRRLCASNAAENA